MLICLFRDLVLVMLSSAGVFSTLGVSRLCLSFCNLREYVIHVCLLGFVAGLLSNRDWIGISVINTDIPRAQHLLEHLSLI